ncbi:MAG: uroporphyrinogen-III C-methyltransferase [Pirellulaceae bacterium]
MTKGKVYLVGAGPGDPGLITLRAAEILRRADAVLYDYLANPAILAHCRPAAIKIPLGKHGRTRILAQDEINERLVTLAQEFGTVVRLKSGDPMVFGRAAEEIDCLVRHGIEFEIVPGVTAALAAGSYAGIPMTHRDVASAVAFVTGREHCAGEADREGEAGREGEVAEPDDSSLDYAALARFPGTLVFYMGVTTARHWSSALVAAGKPATTPVAVVRRVSLLDQTRLDTTLGEVAAAIQAARLRPPVVFVIGDVAATGDAWSWFQRRPLFGQRVLVTRPAHQAAELAAPLAELGAEVLLQPAIEIRPAADAARVDRMLELMDRFDWLVFSSSNGVRFLLDQLLNPGVGRDLRALGNVKIAAVGPGTAEELARYHLRADLVPQEFRAEALAAALREGAAGKRFLLVRASRGREVLADELTRAGGIVEQLVAYESVDVEQPEAEIAERLAAGQIEWTTVTSSAIARSLVRMFGAALARTKLVSISPLTSATLRELGYEPAAEAQEYTLAGVIAAVRAAAAG